MATAHLISGFLGAGKTAFSLQLAQRRRAVRFSVDELYLRLFAQGPTYELDRNAEQRLLTVLDELWPQVLSAGADVVLDFGLWRRTRRDQLRELARSMGAQSRLYWVRCPEEIALRRCLARNGTHGSFLISEDGFRALQSRFEAPAPDEAAEIVETFDSGG